MVSPYRIVLTPAADKDLDRLPRAIELRIALRIDALGSNPRPSGIKQIAGRPGYYRIRVGDYRVIYEIDGPAATVRVALVGHRRDVYDRMERRR